MRDRLWGGRADPYALDGLHDVCLVENEGERADLALIDVRGAASNLRRTAPASRVSGQSEPTDRLRSPRSLS